MNTTTLFDIINWYTNFRDIFRNVIDSDETLIRQFSVKKKSTKSRSTLQFMKSKKSLNRDNKKNLTIFDSKWQERNKNLCNMRIETESKSWIILLYLKWYLSKTRIHDDQIQKLQCYFDDIISHVIENVFPTYFSRFIFNQHMFLPHYMIINFPINVLNGYNT